MRAGCKTEHLDSTATSNRVCGPLLIVERGESRLLVVKNGDHAVEQSNLKLFAHERGDVGESKFTAGVHQTLVKICDKPDAGCVEIRSALAIDDHLAVTSGF